MSNKRIDFTKTGGFPLTQNALNFMQDSYRNAIEGLANLAGNKIIISGMEESNGQVSNGWIFWNGEILPFEGGPKQMYFTITENKESEVFEDNNVHEVYFSKKAKFGGSLLFSELIRLSEKFVPTGLISMWSGNINQIPKGWALCDGQNGTPDLRGRFIVGYNSSDDDYDEIGKIGGEDKHVLSESELPSHSHNITIESAGAHIHGYYHPTAKHGNADNNRNKNYDATKSQSLDVTTPSGLHSHSATIAPTGNGMPHENRPPFYTLAYIIKK